MPASSAIQQSLSSLLPTHAQKLPAQLTHLCESLLAQSRQRACHLKPEEEIARAYACCEIACKRLRAQCRLPATQPGGAPCKPTLYEKLVMFLERVLDEDPLTTTPQSGRNLKRTADGVFKGAETSQTGTPSKNPARNGFLGKLKASANSTTKNTDVDGAGTEAPSFTMPSIRRLCKTFKTPLLAPHVYTGACVVLKLAELWPQSQDEDEEPRDTESLKETVTGLLIALYLMTLTRMQTAKMTTSVYKSTCSKSVEELDYKPGTAGVELWIRRINREGYCRRQDWWASVPESVFKFDPHGTSGGARTIHEDSEDDDDEEPFPSAARKRQVTGPARRNGVDEEDDDPEGILLPGLATMMQDAVDFLTPEHTEAHNAWKKQFLKRLDKLDKTPAGRLGRTVVVK
ncbi:uncharacterized protein Z518_10859 [Rhinocladiella mackenziei CBS 650.93]|uniref:ORC6 first cyclin-like domain-containing protein n=1 Tax=Rhinocladiella mackenziei CBS 650.93 TaxID=1442369 RepID=A0A0D2FCX1_9EURO|nr:uncharacterized protein Z518_10859 [Rhinocladiella mackenziei CBS 650.93]KIW99931.1 hypothetical protein Z518_10859 [Rhinocladiella mackenziei CBS 650.93]